MLERKGLFKTINDITNNFSVHICLNTGIQNFLMYQDSRGLIFSKMCIKKDRI